MGRLIDEDDVLTVINKHYIVGHGVQNATLDSIEEEILQLSSEQPEIIHCSECRYSLYKDGEIWVCGHPNHNAWNIRDDHFCGYAVREEDG